MRCVLWRMSLYGHARGVFHINEGMHADNRVIQADDSNILMFVSAEISLNPPPLLPDIFILQ